MPANLLVVILVISSIRLAPHILIATFLDKKGLIRSDVIRWSERLGLREPVGKIAFYTNLIQLLTLKKEYRNVFYNRAGRRTSWLTSWLCPPLESLIIYTYDIGPGFFIQHGMSTIISARKIGSNCWINQQVTIGFSNATDQPTIGDNVRISAGAKVVGAVVVGDGATVGLNTVVTANVPSYATVFGVPGQVVWRSKER